RPTRAGRGRAACPAASRRRRRWRPGRRGAPGGRARRTRACRRRRCGEVSPRASCPALANLAQDQPPADALQPIDEEDAVQVVDLVLDRARQQPLALDRALAAAAIEMADADAHRPWDRRLEAWQAQAAFELEL